MSEEKSVEQLLKEKKIYEVINKRLVEASPSISIVEAVRLLQEKRAGYVVLAENKKVKGIFTETDVTRNLLGKDIDWKEPVSRVMTQDPVVLTASDNVGKAIDLMEEKHFYHIPLVDKEGNLAGLLSVRSLIRFLAEFYPTEILNLPPDPDQMMESREGG